MTGKTYVGADTNDEKGTGTMPNVSDETNITLTSQDTRKVIVQNTLGDRVWEINNSDGQRRTCIQLPKTGYYNDNSIIATPSSNIGQAGGLNASKLANGQSAFGITGTYKGRGNADPSRVLSGSTFSSDNLDNANGTIPIIGGNNITPQIHNQTAISAGQYAGGNIVINAQPLPPANAIKKGYRFWVGNNYVDGTFEGYVVTDPFILYEKGGINEDYGIELYQGELYTDEDGNKYQAITQFDKENIFVHTAYNSVPSNFIQTEKLINFEGIKSINVSIRSKKGVSTVRRVRYTIGVYKNKSDKERDYVNGNYSTVLPSDSISSYETITHNLYLTEPIKNYYFRLSFTLDSYASDYEIGKIWFT